MRERKTVRERKKRGGKKKRDFPGVPTVGARQSEKKSRSTHSELRVGTKILKFRQTPLDREFSYLDYFYPKDHLMAWAFFGVETGHVF